MAEPNGLARSSRYSGVAGGCSVETKARDKAVVTDGIKEMEELPGSLCISRKLRLCGKGVAPWQDVARVAAKRLHASAEPRFASLVSLKKKKRDTRNATGSRQFSSLGRGRVWGRGEKGSFRSSSVDRRDRIGRYDTFDDG